MRTAFAHLVTLFAFAAVANPAGASGYASPAEIDHAVSGFTGAAIGRPGGARLPTDPRLRLAACASPLVLAWHTADRSSVRVACAGPVTWEIFVAVAPLASPQSGTAAVKRGDMVMLAVRGRGFSLQQPGEAIASGQIGDWILVRTARNAEALRARIERPGLVVITAP